MFPINIEYLYHVEILEQQSRLYAAVSAAADEALSAAVIKNGAVCFYDKLDLTHCKIYEVLEKHQS